MEFNSETDLMKESPDVRSVGRDFIGAVILLVFSLLTITILFIPELFLLINTALGSNEISGWLPVLITILIVGYLIIFPVVLVIKGYFYYRNSLIRRSS